MAIIHGVDVNSKLIPLLVDASGRPLVVLGPSDENIGNVDVLTTPNAVDKYTLSYVDQQANTSLPAGASTLLSTAIGANLGGVIKQICIQYIGTIATVYLTYGIKSGGVYYRMGMISPVVSAFYNPVRCDYVLKAGDQVFTSVYNATLNDDLYLYVNGYTFPVV